MNRLKKLAMVLPILALMAFLIFTLTKQQLAPSVIFTTIEGKKLAWLLSKAKWYW